MIAAMRGAFVTGTGTGVGKTVAAAALCAALRADGRAVLASKPLLSGMDDAPPTPWPHDHDLLALVTGEPAEVIAPVRFGPAVSPHLAARWAGETLTVAALVSALQARVQAATSMADDGPAAVPTVIVEGAGGLLVPIDDEATTMADLAGALRLPLIVVAHPGLGTLNHVLLTLEAARARALPVAGIVLTPWPADPSAIELDNRALLTAQTGVPVLALGRVDGPDPAALAAAGSSAGLPRLV